MRNGFLVLALVFATSSSFAQNDQIQNSEAKLTGASDFKSSKITQNKKFRLFRVSMRVGIAGSAPIAINSIAKNGKKTSISEFSEDGRTETLVEMIAQKSQMNNRPGVWMDVTVSKRVNGKTKATEKTQLFTFENEESEVRVGPRGKGKEDLSLAVMAREAEPEASLAL